MKKEVKMGMWMRGVRLQVDGREWRMPGLFYADDLVLCGESEKKCESQKKNSKVILLGREEGLECEVCADGIRLEHVSEFKYLGCVLDETGTDEAESGE